MTKARIYKPSKNPMQSGRARTKNWFLEYQGTDEHKPEALMGWSSAEDALAQVRLSFESLDEARSYADAKDLDYSIIPQQERRVKPRNYGDNFVYTPPQEKI